MMNKYKKIALGFLVAAVTFLTIGIAGLINSKPKPAVQKIPLGSITLSETIKRGYFKPIRSNEDNMTATAALGGMCLLLSFGTYAHCRREEEHTKRLKELKQKLHSKKPKP